MRDLSLLTETELSDLKTEWYVEAQTSGKISDVYLVGKNLGTRLDANYGPKYSLKTGDLEIFVDGYGGYATADYKGKPVMNTHPCTRLYVPGPWEEIIQSIKENAVERRNKNMQDESDRRKKNLLSQLQP